MSAVMKLAALAAAVVACAVAAVASAAPTPLSPTAGSATTALRPIFRWRLPSNEVAETIGVAKSPTVSPTGEFVSANIVGLDQIAPDATSHSFDQPFAAGTYWWHVTSHDTTFVHPGHLFTRPVKFTIRATISSPSVAVRVAGHGFLATVKWNANVTTMLVKGRLLSGTKQLVSHQSKSSGILGVPAQDIEAWTIPASVKRGTKLRFVVTLSVPGSKVASTVTKTIAAP
jgi:hypothetical protein